MCRCTARGGCESEKGARVRNRGRTRGSKPAISYAKQSGNTRCMHTASPEPRSKIMEHGPFHPKWLGKDGTRIFLVQIRLLSSLLPPPHLRKLVERVFPYCFPRYSPPTVSRDSNVCDVCTRSTCHGCPIFEESRVIREL